MTGNLLVRGRSIALLQRYVAWREECRALWRAYQRWTDSTRRECGLAYAGYLAALDREDLTARTYADQIKRVTRTSP